MKTQSAFLVITLLLSQQIFANNFVTQKIKENPKSSIFKILEEGFNKAADPIDASDLPILKEGGVNVLNILFPDVTPQTEAKDLKAGGFIVVELTIKGIEDKGPLLPGTPNYKVPFYGFCSKKTQLIDYEKMESWVPCETRKSEPEENLMNAESVPKTFYRGRQIDVQEYYYDSKDVFKNISFRKSGNLIFMRIDQRNVTTYNYIWKD